MRATPLLSVVLILTCWQAIRLWTAVAWYDVLQEFSPQPGPVYTAVSGAFWLGIGLVLAWGMWRKMAWAANLLIGASAGYTVWYWADRLILQGPRANWPFALLLNIFLLACVLAAAIPRYSSKDHLERGL